MDPGCYATKKACPGGVINQLMASTLIMLHQQSAVVKSIFCDAVPTNKIVMRLCGINSEY
jgi:hypothetical protein